MSRQKIKTGMRQKKLFAVGLSMLLALYGYQPVMAREENSVTYEQYVCGEYRETGDASAYEIIRIYDEEQLQELAAACTYDAWSQDKHVLLEADLDLTGRELMIPVFGGILDGQGHVIKGLVIRQEGSQMGLIRYLQQNAVIQNLVVEGAKVQPQGSGCQTGILVGRNYGSIVSCRVSGILEGEDEIGGITGVNEESGVIRSCTAEVTVVGNRRSGGITGSNHGVINNCANKGGINIYADDMTFDLEELTVENLEESDSNTRLDAHMDTGGIAGFSDGKIYYCNNSGVVGYAHVGYNTGGIVGRLHQGYIQNCTNTGNILGRKDVGGIAGQMEPFMEIEYIDGKLDELDREMDIFLDMVETNYDHLGAYGNQVTSISRQLNTNLRNLTDAFTNLLNITHDLWQVYNQELTGISNDFDRLADDLESIGAPVIPETPAGDNIQLPDREDLEEQLEETPQLPDREELQDRLEETPQLPDREDLEDQLEETPQLPNREELQEQLEGWQEELESVSGNGHIGENGSSDSPIKNWEKPEYTEAYKDALSGFADSTGSHLHKMTDVTSQKGSQMTNQMEVFDGELQSAMDQLLKLSETLEDAQGVMDTDVGALIDQARKLRRLISEIRDDLFGYEGITIEDTSDEAPSDSIENTGAGEQERELLQDGDTVTEKWYDTTSFQQGKITLCLNRGQIEADSNVGGIVGQIATEHDLDPEDDITLTGPESLSIQESIRAVVRESRNEGRITSKKDCVGGVAGKADFGAIISCESYADIQSTGGSYVGGIAGRSEDTIRSCFSKGFLKGKSYVGGIVGMGSEIYYCDAMNQIKAEGEKLGAIAGEVTEDGLLYDNYYVSGSVDGIDGIGYEGGAIPLSYEEFVAREGLPEEFQLLTLRFVILDEDQELQEEVAVLQVPYGSSLSPEQLPTLPQREGYYGNWPEIDYSHITESRELAAEYTKWITALEFWQEDLVEQQAAILVEGCFYPEDVLEVDVDENNSYAFEIRTSEGFYDQSVSVRLHQSLLPEHYEIHLQQEEKDVTIESRVMGSYVVFRMEHPGAFRIVSVSPQIPVRYIVIGGAGLLMILLIIIGKLIRHRSAKRGKDTAGKDAEASEQTVVLEETVDSPEKE